MRGKTMRKQILISLASVLVVVGIVIGWYLVTQRHVGRLVAQGERTNILLLGLDKVGDTSRSDTMILLSLAPGEDVVLISLPRDLRVKFANGEFHKLNAAYPLGGGKLARETVSALLGIEVPFYVSLDYAGFEHLIDQLGGITLTVEERMLYNDERADPPLHIDIQPGTQTFDGKTALDYIRYRGETGDLGRIAHQQKLIAAILEKGVQDQDYTTIRKMLQEIYPYLNTDLSLIDLYDLAKLVQGLNRNQVQMATVPGIPVVIDEISYLEPQVVEMERLIARMIKGIDLLTANEISIAVYNGNGVRLMASNTADYLRKRDFRITKVSNAESFNYEKTYIVVLTEEAKAWILEQALPGEATVVTPEDFAPHYEALAPPPEGTDLLLIAGAGFEVENE
jgi:LCP family protein required for cell wall assembly